jgi:galactokinase
VESVGAGLGKESNKNTPVVIRVPGVTTLFGEFSYYCHGRVLCCANDRVLRVSVTRSPDTLVHVHNALTNDRKRFSMSSLKFRREDKWGNYIKGVYLQLADMGIKPVPLDFDLDGPVLKDDSAVLAAAVSVGAALAVLRFIPSELDNSGLAMLCYRCCTSFCGENTKFSTVTAMLSAQAGKYILFDLNSLSYRILDDPFENSGCSMIAVDCRIPPMAMREELRNRHTMACESFARLHSVAPNQSLRDFPLSDLRERILPLDEETRKTCNAILEDSSAASSMARLFQLRQFSQIGKAIGKMGKLMRDDLELTCPEIDWVMKRATEIPLCHGAGIMFNGDNTYVVAVIDDGAIDQYQQRLDDYERIFGFKPRFQVLKPHGCAVWD